MTVDAAIKKKAGTIQLAVFDVDGVMTDGSIQIGPDGSEFKSFHVHDGMGLVLLQKAGIGVAVISSRTSEAVSRRMSELGITKVLQGVTEKKQALTALLADLGIDNNAVAYVGDDVVDLPAMALAGLAIAVANARAPVRARADWITTAPGGGGAVREVCDLLLETQDKLTDK